MLEEIKKLWEMFKLMQEACLRPTELTFVSVMTSCSTARVANHVLAQAVKSGFETFTSVSNAAITMYSGCGICMLLTRFFKHWRRRISYHGTP